MYSLSQMWQSRMRNIIYFEKSWSYKYQRVCCGFCVHTNENISGIMPTFSLVSF
jgi:hypothetical protein